jgi:uncharacterized protein YecT (DUF1311 family)
MMVLFVAVLPEPAACAETAAVSKAEWADLMKNPEFRAAERRLGEAYKAALAARSEADRQALRDAQRQWNAQREKAAFEQFGKGTPHYARFFIDAADARSAELQPTRPEKRTSGGSPAAGPDEAGRRSSGAVGPDAPPAGAGAGDGKGGFTMKSSRQYAGLSLELSVSYPQGLGKAADAAVQRTAQALFDETVAAYEKEAAERVAEEPGDAPASYGWEIITDYTLFRPSDRCASVLFSTYASTGGAHPNQYLTARTYDTAAGRELTTGDLFPGNVPLAALTRHIVENVLRQKKARGADVTGDEKNNVDPTMDRILLTPAGMRIVYAPYEMGSYAEGSYIVDIRKQDAVKLGADPALWR